MLKEQIRRFSGLTVSRLLYRKLETVFRGLNPWAYVLPVATRYLLVQIRRSLFAMDHSCNHGGYEAPNVCWSLAKRRTTASGERPSLARRFRVVTMPDPSRQCSWRATVADRSAPWVHAANRSQYDPCVLGRRDALLTSSLVETQDGRADAGRSQARTASSDLA
jgi:hypothetical protein